ncbi:MAG TPA: metallopeptidase family protein [Candidatus Methylomirabilis sp.]|jgi:predicted Zn-dependent protease with MMP-like domain|nr:metallopeptidase family protein [Candidatus Methylomirabilis sp.]
MNRKRFARLVTEALETLPEELRSRMANVEVVIADWPTPEDLEEAGLGPEDTLFGLYQGTPLPERGVEAPPLFPDKITIFQGPLEEWCDGDAETREEIRTTVVHEIAHHFGIGEERLTELGWA